MAPLPKGFAVCNYVCAFICLSVPNAFQHGYLANASYYMISTSLAHIYLRFHAALASPIIRLALILLKIELRCNWFKSYCVFYTLVGIWCQNDVVSTSMRHNHVASTLIRRHFYVMCPLGRIQFIFQFVSHYRILHFLLAYLLSISYMENMRACCRSCS